MTSSTSNVTKPDWMFRIGCGLWIAIGWGVLRVLGWHIPPWVWWTVLVMVLSMIFEYAQILKTNRNRAREQELEELKERVGKTEEMIVRLCEELRKYQPDNRIELRHGSRWD